MSDREKLIDLISDVLDFVDWGNIGATADHLIANGVVIQKQGEMNSLEAVEKFRDELTNKFLRLCDYNDYNKINLLTIADTVDSVYDRCIDGSLQAKMK